MGDGVTVYLLISNSKIPEYMMLFSLRKASCETKLEIQNKQLINCHTNSGRPIIRKILILLCKICEVLHVNFIHHWTQLIWKSTHRWQTLSQKKKKKIAPIVSVAILTGSSIKQTMVRCYYLMTKTAFSKDNNCTVKYHHNLHTTNMM